MISLFSLIKRFIENFVNNLKLGMRYKLILIFVIIKVIPLLILTYIANQQARHLGLDVIHLNQNLIIKANDSLQKVGATSVDQSVKALNDFATENIERISTEMARQVADFLYQRDGDILYVAGFKPDEAVYRHFIESRRKDIIKQRKWMLAQDGKSWVPEESSQEAQTVLSSNQENNTSFSYRPPDRYETESRPLYLEMTYIDLNGNELIKVNTSGVMDSVKRNVADRRNTFARAETYFEELKKLKPGEIYVSDVIGAYVGSHIIGRYTPGNAAALKVEFKPEEEAYAGEENPNGKRFKGIVRWASPVVQSGTSGEIITGYVTLALNHDHLMEFTDHSTPLQERYAELPSAYDGNYAFIWDYKCRSICHPRHHSIAGYNPETGDPEVPWLEQSIYDEWQKSGLPYTEFIKDVPVFNNQSRDKKGSAELVRQGLVGLDGRYLNHAPQCTGWFDLTSEGGSGSFLILWSGLWKLTTAATIPYYTGRYGQSKRGFGFVAIGAGFEDFQRPAHETKIALDELIADANADLSLTARNTEIAIETNLFDSIVKNGISVGVMIIFMVLIAIWMASAFTGSITRLISGIDRFRTGERQFRFNAVVKDEIGTLADSFDEMADSLVAGDRGAVTIIDSNFQIIYINNEGIKTYEIDLAEACGKPYSQVSIYPINSPYDPIAALHAGRTAEVLFLPKLGRYVKGSATNLTNKSGEKIGYIITTTDLTDIVLQQKKTEEQKVLLDTIFSLSPDLIWYEDSEGQFLAVNPRFALLSGKSQDEFAGLKLENILNKETALRFRANDKEALKLHRPFYSEETLTFADGHKEILDTVITPIFDADNTLTGFLGFARDVSGRVAIEKELRKTKEELEQAIDEANTANEHKGSFLARMSHEIRTPMNAIIGMTNIVKRKLGEDAFDLNGIRAHIDQIEDSSQHLLGLLNDILDFSKIEAGKIELSDDVIDMFKLADTVSTIIKPRCAEKNINFEIRFDIPADTSYRADSLRLRQVLINLLGNAVKFTPERGKIIFIIAKQESRGGKTLLRFSVSDTGIGISEETLGSLFKPFEQAGNQITKKYGGTGLGLVISRNIVQLFGGDISVKSKVNEGSEFSFSIWLSQCGFEKEAEVTIEDATGLFRGKRALLADDVAINRLIVINLLEYTGIEIDEADDGVSAVKIFADSPPYTYDIIYMDIQMPIMDGYEAARKIRAMDRPDAASVPIVALTANAFKEDIEKALINRMNAHLAKPMEPDKVLEVTLKVLKNNNG
ncbi:MAG: PAS domain-containing protein [Treponema sp.]|jgi:PAS domain S-box-containing protein|nr:PAS domain-containing protein [Treponema sp.]